MNFKAIAIYIGHILSLEGILMLPAAAIAIGCRESAALKAFLITAAVTFVIGQAMSKIKTQRKGIYARDGFITVAMCWIAISVFGALPFWISGAIPNYVDCLFETVSGFTTTGATILSEIESLPKSVLYWRSFTHWVGGMGVLVFMLAVVSHSKGSGDTLHLLRAESPGPVVGKLTPTMKSTTRILYGIYIMMTAILVFLLLAGGMSLFDAVCHAFATAGTGGFSTMNASIAAYQSSYIHIVLAFGMVMFGVNFNIYYLILMGKTGVALANEELKTYLAIIAASIALITINIIPLYESFWIALRDSFFQVSSIITTTGFVTADFNIWPQFSRFLIVVIMMIGASAGSTGGGIKVTRLLILAKASKSEAMRLSHPQLVNTPRMDGKCIEDSVVRGTYIFMIFYIFICVISMTFIAAIDNFSTETTVTAVLTCISNVGPGLDMVGPTGNFCQFSYISKIILSFVMLAGRLEIFPMLMLFGIGGRKIRRKSSDILGKG